MSKQYEMVLAFLTGLASVLLIYLEARYVKQRLSRMGKL